jgi:hypothetical protein
VLGWRRVAANEFRSNQSLTADGPLRGLGAYRRRPYDDVSIFRREEFSAARFLALSNIISYLDRIAKRPAYQKAMAIANARLRFVRTETPLVIQSRWRGIPQMRCADY